MQIPDCSVKVSTLSLVQHTLNQTRNQCHSETLVLHIHSVLTLKGTGDRRILHFANTMGGKWGKGDMEEGERKF